MGPDLSNRHERIWLASYKANFNSGILNGLTSTLSIANAYGAFNTLGSVLGSGNESWSEIDLRYKLKALKKLSIRLRYRDYTSLKTGQIAGIKDDRDELRFTIDYQRVF